MPTKSPKMQQINKSIIDRSINDNKSVDDNIFANDSEVMSYYSDLPKIIIIIGSKL